MVKHNKRKGKRASFKTVSISFISRFFWLQNNSSNSLSVQPLFLISTSYLQKHKRHKKKPVKLKYEEPDELKRAPHSFVIHRGKVGKYILELEKDFRKVMDPFTASQLQVHLCHISTNFISHHTIILTLWIHRFKKRTPSKISYQYLVYWRYLIW